MAVVGARHGKRLRPASRRRSVPKCELLFGHRKFTFEFPFDYYDIQETLPASFKYTLFKATNTQMPKVEITVPEHLEMQIAQLVEKGEFVNREAAIEELLSTGLRAYKTSGPMEEEEPGFEEESGMMGHEDEYVF
jgi:Arc/MetJ-type ribon-helix-helix transcriptional regulator